MPDAFSFEQLLRRDRAITLTGLAVLCALAWLYILAGAGTGMSAWEMTTLSLFPHKSLSSPATPPHWSAGMWLLMIAMWWIMMIAMMAPSAAPTLLLYARVHRHSAAQARVTDAAAFTGAFAAGYLCI